MIEAQTRLGGRIPTLDQEHVPIELGAEFIHGLSKPLLETMREASHYWNWAADPNIRGT